MFKNNRLTRHNLLLALRNIRRHKGYSLINAAGWPIAFYAMHKWLQGFAFRTKIGWEIFLLSAGLALIISVFTISLQSIKAAKANPVESLRNE